MLDETLFGREGWCLDRIRWLLSRYKPSPRRHLFPAASKSGSVEQLSFPPRTDREMGDSRVSESRTHSPRNHILSYSNKQIWSTMHSWKTWHHIRCMLHPILWKLPMTGSKWSLLVFEAFRFALIKIELHKQSNKVDGRDGCDGPQLSPTIPNRNVFTSRYEQICSIPNFI